MSVEMKELNRFVKNQIRQLNDKKESSERAILAKLRRGIGKSPGSTPELWEITLKNMPEFTTNQDEPTRSEWAVHTALTLYALHQQGKERCMSEDGGRLGVSLRRLIKNEDDEKRIKRRFDAAATSDSLEEFSHHLRGLIQILKSEEIPLDYPSLAEDLYRYQIPEARDAVRLRWGRDFYCKEIDKENE